MWVTTRARRVKEDEMAVVHGPVVVRRRLGAVLKRLRGECGLDLQGVARQLEISASKLSRLETGQVAPRIRDVRDLLEIYGAPSDLRSRVLQWASEAKEPGWWQPFSPAIPNDLDMYISLEVEAKKIKMFSLPIPGLLQTEAYARMFLSGAAPHCSPSELDRLVEIQVRRQVVLADRPEAAAVQLHVVLDESSLQRGGPNSVMREQLQELHRRSRWPNVTLQVLPFESGYLMASSTFAIFEPRDDTDVTVVNVESTGQDAYFDTAGEIAKYENIWADVVRRALAPERSRDLIERVLSQLT
jgi:transcriptional regulator with XRE-family HTH domain